MALEVVWPRHKWDYLTVPDADMPVNPPPLPSTWAGAQVRTRSRVPQTDDPGRVHRGEQPTMRQTRGRVARGGRGNGSHASIDSTRQQGRVLAVHAFLQGARCRERRVSELLEVSARTVGRDRARPPLTAAPILERAQECIAASAVRGSTAEERAAALAFVAACSRLPVVEAGGPGAGTPGPPLPDCSSVPGERATAECSGSAPPVEVPMSAERRESPSHASWTRDQVDACGRLHRRIPVRTDGIRRLLEPEIQRDDLIEVVLELLVEIRGATEALETLMSVALVEKSRDPRGAFTPDPQ
jgi:hypothetical protein